MNDRTVIATHSGHSSMVNPGLLPIFVQLEAKARRHKPYRSD